MYALCISWNLDSLALESNPCRGSKIKKFDDLTALRILLTEVKHLRDTPDYHQADFLTSQGDNRHCISSIDYVEQLLEQILADNIAW